MPLKPSEILRQLHDRQADFTAYNQATLNAMQRYQQALRRISEWAPAAYATAIQQLPSDCGAYPLEAIAGCDRGVMRCGLTWESREASLAWVRDRLADVRTFAVDGSQIFPTKDVSLLVALVQIGWYENCHTATGTYAKDIDVVVMTPADLASGDRPELIDRKVNIKRFQLECDRLVAYMQEQAGNERCLVFFDGSLVATFAEAFADESRDQYVGALVHLLETSRTCQIPLVGYIDTSYARDLVTLLRHLEDDLPDLSSIHDAQILNLALKNHWGDRTPLCLCRRSGILADYGDERDQITFTYLKANLTNNPARLEIPRWVFDTGRLDQVLDWVRGEIIVGSGYPYVIETADQTAVLQSHDRQIFYRLLQDWAATAQLNLRLSRKIVSKTRRRG